MKTKCSKCDSADFEIVNAQIKGSEFPFSFIRCTTCKSAISVIESLYVPEKINTLQSEIKELKNQISSLSSSVASLISNVK